jgi:hypothetical protein
MYDENHQLLGIPVGSTEIVSQGNRRQCIPYTHMESGVSTILPTDLIHLNGTWTMAAMVVGMAGLGHELRTVFWQSHDLVEWHKTDPYIRFDHPGHPGNVMLTFDQIGDGYVYIFGTGGLARDRGIWLWRCAVDTFPHGLWEPWGLDQVSWGWNVPNERTPVLMGKYGELSFRQIQGNSVLSFFDVEHYCCTALTVPHPTYNWTRANHVNYAHGHEFPQLYGGYITDDSRLSEANGMKFTVSQWNTQTNDPYHVIAFADTLDAQGPIVETPIEPEEQPPVDPTEPSDPQGTYELLLRELAASGSTEILTSDGRKLTLREAVGEVYEATCSLHALKGQPQDPRTAAPQLDHILSGRAEQLFTQTVVVAIADRFGIDTQKLYDDVKAGLG